MVTTAALTVSLQVSLVCAGVSCGGRNCVAMRRRRGRGTVAVCLTQRLPARFLQGGDVVVDGGPLGHDGVGWEARWPRRYATVAGGGLGSFAPTGATRGGGEWGERVVHGV